MPRRKLRHVRTIIGQRFHFRCHPQAAFFIVPPIQRHHAHRIAGDDGAPVGLVPQREREDAVQAVEERGRRVFAIQRVDHLAIGLGLEGVGLREFGFEGAMVVDLAIDRQRQLAIVRQQRLRATGGIDDGKPFMHQDRAGIQIHPAPIRATMAQAARAFQRFAAQVLAFLARLQVEDSEDGAHSGDPY